MKNQSLGFNYLLGPKFYLGLEAGHQKLELYQTNKEVDNLFITPRIGIQFINLRHFFLQSDVGLQINFHHQGSDYQNEVALDRFAHPTTFNFTLMRLGFWF